MSKINFKKSNNQAVGKITLAQEGLISKKDFLKYCTENVINKYVSSGYFTREESGYYKTTEKFNRDFRREYGKINPTYVASAFSPNRSINHMQGIERVTQAIDRKDLINDKVKIVSGKDLSDEYNKICRYSNFKNEMKEYVSQQQNLIIQYQKQLEEINSIKEKTIDDYTNKWELENKLRHSEIITNIYQDPKRDFCSPPDVRFTMEIGTFRTQIDNLRDDLENESLSRREYKNLESTISQMEQYYEQCVDEQETVITYSLESVTNNYREVELIQKENYETITHQKIIYIRV